MEIVLDLLVYLPHSPHVGLQVEAGRDHAGGQRGEGQPLLQLVLFVAFLVVDVVGQLVADLVTVVDLAQPVNYGVPQDEDSSDDG